MFTNTHAYCWDLELGPPSRGSYWERKKLSERHARVTTLSTLGVNPPTTEPPGGHRPTQRVWAGIPLKEETIGGSPSREDPERRQDQRWG
jgi:hypothetical protein